MLSYSLMQMKPNVSVIAHATFGILKPYQDDFNDAVKSLKEQLRVLNNGAFANGKQWLVGDHCTLADIYMAGLLTSPFQTCLDSGFQKGMADVTAWFNKVTRLPNFVRAFGYVKACQKPLKPPKLPAKEKPKVEKKAESAQQVKPKPEQAAASTEEKKAKNPLDELPPTAFDLFNFKTFFVNHPDKKGEGHKAFMEQVDKEGWSFWWLHYEKYGDEGQVSYKFSNLLEGFVQRLEGFKKYSFGRICMLGEEPSLEIMGVLLIRGQVITQELIDHPQFEYMQARKMDWNNADDMALVRDFMASKQDGEKVKDMHVQMALWHK